MTEKLQCLGSVRNFCNLSCLLQYCYMHFETIRHTNGIGRDQQTPLGRAWPPISLAPPQAEPGCC